MAPQKSPAFQFYAKDFLTGTATMSLAEQGRLITAACRAVIAGDRGFFNERVPYFDRPVCYIGNPRYISPPVRRHVYDRDGRRCRHCSTQERLSIDHVVPWSKGGSDAIDNLQTLCMPCNRRKGVN